MTVQAIDKAGAFLADAAAESEEGALDVARDLLDRMLAEGPIPASFALLADDGRELWRMSARVIIERTWDHEADPCGCFLARELEALDEDPEGGALDSGECY